MKTSITILAFILSLTCSCQTVKEISNKDLKIKLIDFLIEVGDINIKEIEDYKNNKYHIDLIGIHNNFKNEILINGIYSFSLPKSHAKIYFLIIDNNNFTILNLANKVGLDKAIGDILEFSEKQKYCSEITNDYISRVIRIYYKNNKNTLAGVDINCEAGIIDTKSLP